MSVTSSTASTVLTHQSSVAILGFCLPLALIVCLVIGLSIRRCVSCYSTTCVSSFCKEELLLALLTLPTTTAQFLTYLPILDTSLTQLELPVTGLASVITPTLARLVEMLSSGALPLLVFILLPAYSNWSSQPDNDDIRTGYRSNIFLFPVKYFLFKEIYFRRSRRDQSTNAPDSRRDSLTSFGFD